MHLFASLLGLLLAPTPLAAQDEAPTHAEVPNERSLVPMIVAELRPEPWLGAGLGHSVGDDLWLDHSLTFAFNSFPHFELRTNAIPTALEPFGAWLAYRFRRVDLEGLPPVENSLSVGISATARARVFSASAGLGLRFQLPPLPQEAANDIGTYALENLHVDFFFAVRLHPW